MALYDNPAGRLYEVLARYSSRSSESMLSAWAYALEVEPDRVLRFLPDVRGLIDATKQAIAGMDQDFAEDLPEHLDHLAGTVANPIHTALNAPGGAGSQLPDTITMTELMMLSKYLHQHHPEARVPEQNEVDELVEQVRELIGAVTDADDFPPEIKRLLLQHLSQILEAIEHVRVGGPEAVRLAALTLLGSAALAAHVQKGKHGALFERLKETATRALVICAAFAPLGANALGWEQVIQGQLPSPPAHIVVVAEPAPDQPATPALAGETDMDGQAPADGTAGR